MDNVTHTLIGVTVAHAVTRRWSEDQRVGRRAQAVFWASVLANNAPDIDVVTRWFGLADQRLYTLLQHRGLTHTLIAVPLLGILAAWIGARIAGVKFRDHRGVLLGVAAVGGLFHILADSWNDYGVHPFSPFWDRWFYGDFLFILEPTLWVALLPLAFFRARTKGGRFIAAFFFAGVIAASWISSLVPWPVAVGVSVWAAVMVGLQYRFRSALLAGGMSVLILAKFWTASQVVRHQVQAALAAQAPQERFSDLALAPLPGNPACWRAISATVDPAGTYIMRIAAVTWVPSLFDPATCVPEIDAPRTARLEPAEFPTTASIYWVGTYRKSLTELTSEAIRNCRFDAFLGFARFPFWERQGETLSAGDLRYDRGRSRGFAEFELRDGQDCSTILPHWLKPALRTLHLPTGL